MPAAFYVALIRQLHRGATVWRDLRGDWTTALEPTCRPCPMSAHAVGRAGSGAAGARPFTLPLRWATVSPRSRSGQVSAISIETTPKPSSLGSGGNPTGLRLAVAGPAGAQRRRRARRSRLGDRHRLRSLAAMSRTRTQARSTTTNSSRSGNWVPPRQARSGSTRDWTRWSCSAGRKSPATSRQATSSIGQSASRFGDEKEDALNDDMRALGRRRGRSQRRRVDGSAVDHRPAPARDPRHGCRSIRATPAAEFNFERRPDRGLHSGRPDRRRRTRQSLLLAEHLVALAACWKSSPLAALPRATPLSNGRSARHSTGVG
jgi:hypothetical protein